MQLSKWHNKKSDVTNFVTSLLHFKWNLQSWEVNEACKHCIWSSVFLYMSMTASTVNTHTEVYRINVFYLSFTILYYIFGNVICEYWSKNGWEFDSIEIYNSYHNLYQNTSIIINIASSKGRNIYNKTMSTILCTRRSKTETAIIC